MKRSNLERAMETRLIQVGVAEEWVTEHEFHPDRKWRFDFAWLPEKVAVECNGGIWSNGAHARGSGLSRDYEKLNTAAALGWTVLQFGPSEINSGEAAETVKRTLDARKAKN